MTPTGESALYIECTSTDECYGRAAKACPDGYQIVDRGAHEEVTTGQALSHGLQAMGDSLNSGCTAEAQGSGSSAACASVKPQRPPPRGVKVREFIIRCTQYGANDTAAPRRPPPPREPPDGVAGFAFGTAVEEAEAECVGAKLAWTIDDATFTCSGVPSKLGLDAANTATVSLMFCNRHLCSASVSLAPRGGDPEGLAEIFREVSAQLNARYGSPAARDVEIPRNCKKSTEFVGCLESGDASATMSWKWESGEAIRLELTPTHVLVTYLNGAGVRALKARGL